MSSDTTKFFQLLRLPFAEDVSAGAVLEGLARQVGGIAKSEINLPPRSRRRLFDFVHALETDAALADEWMLAAHAEEIA